MIHSDIIIFTGPTIALDQAKQQLDATYLPPVKFGDVYQITELYQPKIIGIIDGYFNQVPAVWHKEILWAIENGITVYGAASMGALRAAELNQFGMKGCGKIYHAYRAGVLPPFIGESFEDDDEVAVVHGPAELGYKQASEAMVNIRFTLAKALQQKLIDTNELIQLTKIAKSLFYPEREFLRIFELAKQQNFCDQKLLTLRQWTKDNLIDQKQVDAIEMLNQISADLHAETKIITEDKPIFEQTSQWQTAVFEIEQLHVIQDPVLNEVRLIGDGFFDLMDKALTSALTNNQQQNPVRTQALSMLHQAPDELDNTLDRHWQLRQARSTAETLPPSQCDQILLRHLEQFGHIGEFSDRAQDKKNKLNRVDKMPGVDDLNEIDLLQLSDWYFTQQLGKDLPDQLESYANQLGFADIDDFYDMILKEYYYLLKK